MRNSIQQFSTDCPIDLEGIQNSFFADPTKIAEFVENGSKPFIDAALRFIGETFTEIDNAIRNSATGRGTGTLSGQNLQLSSSVPLVSSAIKRRFTKTGRQERPCSLPTGPWGSSQRHA